MRTDPCRLILRWQSQRLLTNDMLDILLFVTGPPSGYPSSSGESITSKRYGIARRSLTLCGYQMLCCWTSFFTDFLLGTVLCAHMSVVMHICSSQWWNVGTRVETQDTWYEYGSDIWMEWLLKTQATCYRLVVSCFKVTDLYLETRQCLSHAEHIESGCDIRRSGTESNYTALSLHAILM